MQFCKGKKSGGPAVSWIFCSWDEVISSNMCLCKRSWLFILFKVFPTSTRSKDYFYSSYQRGSGQTRSPEAAEEQPDPLLRVCRAPCDPEEPPVQIISRALYRTVELRLHKMSQKAAGLILPCLPLSAAKNRGLGGAPLSLPGTSALRVGPDLP